MPTASQKFGILEKTFKGLLNIKYDEVERLCNAYKKADLWTGTSYGRSKRVMNMPMSEVNINSEHILYMNSDDSAFPGNSFDEAGPKLEGRGKNLMSLFVSNSGETNETVNMMSQLYSYLPRSIGNWSTVLETQNPKSRAGKLASENGGIIVKLDGSENKDSTDYRRFGMMRSLGEYQVLWSNQVVCQIVMEKRQPEEFYPLIEERLPAFFGNIDEWSNSEECNKIVQDMADCKNIMVAGRKTSRNCAKFLTKRLQQIKQVVNKLKNEEATGGNAYLIGGSNCPDPTSEDVVIAISKSGCKEGFYSKTLSGENAQMMGICRKSLNNKANVYPFVATKDSLMEKLCGEKNTTVVGDYTSGFSDAYATIATQTGVLPILLAEEFKRRKLEIDTKSLRETHGL